MHFSSIWSIDRTLSGATTLGQSGPGSNGNEGVLRIPQSYSLTGTSSSDCLVLYSGPSSRGSHPSAEMQSVYSAAPADWAKKSLRFGLKKAKFNKIENCTIFNKVLCKFLYKRESYDWVTENFSQAILHTSSSSSSSCRAASTDIPDTQTPLLPVIHHLWQVFRATSCILT